MNVEQIITVHVSATLRDFEPFIYQPYYVGSRPVRVESLRFSRKWGGPSVTADGRGFYAKKDGSASKTRVGDFPPSVTEEDMGLDLWAAGVAALEAAEARVHIDPEETP